MIDEAKCTFIAGSGGDGKVSFHREKYVDRGGPDGGNGGTGGSIFLLTDPNIHTLRFFSGKPKIKAKDGEPGGKDKRHGKNSPDTTIHVPVGTVLYDADTGEQIVDLYRPNFRYCLLRGGKGGRGNWEFRTATNQAPDTAEPGQEGKSVHVQIRLKILAQVGLVGLPNAGKSTLLSVLTRARPKIAGYPFTTLEPNLGVLKTPTGTNLVIADIPGLIEGASDGKGLGTQFLKHIERCKIIVYVLYPTDTELSMNAEQLYRSLVKQLQQVKQELKNFSSTLLDKPSLHVLNKIDLLDPQIVDEIQKRFAADDINLIPLSAATHAGLDNVMRQIEAVYEKFSEEDR